MTNPILEILLAACLWLIVYHHTVYPVLLARIGSRRRAASAGPAPADIAEAALPSMTIIIPAYNEAAVITEKVIDLARTQYPRDRLRIVIAIDGATDQTKTLAEAAVAQYCRGLDVTIHEYPRNIGKVAVLNDQIARASTDIIALNDTSALINPEGLRRAAARFATPGVGVVFATYRLREAGSEGERAYTEFQTTLKANEGALDSPMGGHGALYFFRRALWSPLPTDTINDDFILPMRIVANGAKGVYDEAIVATELERTRTEQEFRRRIRIGAGNMQQAIRLIGLADPRRPWLAFTFLSGKGSRPFMPFIFLLALGLTSMLAWLGSPWYRILLGCELMVLAIAVAVIVLRSPTTPKILAWLGYLVEGHFASFLGALRVLVGRRIKGWQPGTHSRSPS
jgi:cellulose synthase/poly-beta-1,6-N-acetylglucosamine synthase-like glycosyltransferase